MSYTAKNAGAGLSGTGYTDIVSWTGTGTDVINYVGIHNTDTVEATVTVAFDFNGTVRIVAVETLQPNERFQCGPFNLVSTGQKVKAKLAATVTTNNLDAVAMYANQ